MNYPLESLGPERFQQLAQALLVKELPGIVCYPVGMPDGGRDAVGRPQHDSDGTFTIYQVKFSKTNLADDREWVISAATKEVTKVARLKARGASKFVFITNVGGTSHLDVGSMDRLEVELSELLEISVQCWWRDDINRRLDSSWDIKLRYPEVLAGQDLLRLMTEFRDDSSYRRRLNAMKAFVADQYIEDQEVKFKQVELQNRLLDLFVDLPYELDNKAIEEIYRKNFSASRENIDRSGYMELIRYSQSEDLGLKGTAAILLKQTGGILTSQVVVEGAPGQGKSTLAQYLCQVHRIRLLNKSDDYQLLPAEHQSSPVLVPIKVDLRDLSEWLSGNNPYAKESGKIVDAVDRSVETFLARLISVKAGGIEFSVNDLLELSKVTPLFVAFDGLDEVADIKRRAEVVISVSRSIVRLRENCPGLRVVITSRPAAFANSPGFDTKSFPRVQLGSVTRVQIVNYAERWMDARGLNEQERKEFFKILNDKLDQPHLRDLSRNPMQLTILLSLIHTKGPALPDKRTSLYDSYVDLFFSRESTKNSVVRDHLELLKDIHKYLAWILHSRAEANRGAGTAGRFTSIELRHVLNEYLVAEGQSTAIIDEVFSAMLERVVMIVSRIEGTHEFEVQPLREYFAARYLYDTAPYSPPGQERRGTKPDRFDAIARNLHWLNVTRFFCGCFSKGELLDLADRLTILMDDPVWGKSRHPYRLAAMLMSDSVFTQSPKASKETVESLLRPYGIRCLLPAEINFRREEPVRVLGAESEILIKAFDYMVHAGDRADLQQAAASFILENCDPNNVFSAWQKLPISNQDEFENWIYLGVLLECLEKYDKKDLETLLSRFDLSSKVLRALWVSKLESVAAVNAANAEIIRNHILQGSLYLRSEDKLGLSRNYYLFPVFQEVLNTIKIYGSINAEVLGSVSKALLEFRRCEPPVLGDSGCMHSFYQDCYSVSTRISQSLVALNDEFTERQFLVVAVNACIDTFGFCPLVFSISIDLSYLKRPDMKAPDGKDMFDDAKSIIERVAYAKRSAKQWNYWREAFGRTDNARKKYVFHTLLWIFAPLALIVEDEEEIAAQLDSLSLTEWRLLIEVINGHRAIRAHRTTRSNVSKDCVQPTMKSKRFALLLGSMGSAEHSEDAFFKCLIDDKTDEPGFNYYKQHQAIKLAQNGRLSWAVAAQILLDSKGTRFYNHLAGTSSIPENVMNEVLSKPANIPLFLWDHFQDIYSTRIGKKVRTLAQVAKKEKWFT
jgi:hypothetical protein